MEIIRIEPTPNPHTMKITLSEEKEDMKSATYKEVTDDAPEFINNVLEIDDITGVFYAMDFISVDKTPKTDWEEIIPKIEEKFQGNDGDEVKKN